MLIFIILFYSRPGFVEVLVVAEKGLDIEKYTHSFFRGRGLAKGAGRIRGRLACQVLYGEYRAGQMF